MDGTCSAVGRAAQTHMLLEDVDNEEQRAGRGLHLHPLPFVVEGLVLVALNVLLS